MQVHKREKFYPRLGLEPRSLALNDRTLTTELSRTSIDPQYNLSLTVNLSGLMTNNRCCIMSYGGMHSQTLVIPKFGNACLHRT